MSKYDLYINIQRKSYGETIIYIYHIYQIYLPLYKYKLHIYQNKYKYHTYIWYINMWGPPPTRYGFNGIIMKILRYDGENKGWQMSCFFTTIGDSPSLADTWK